MADTEVIVIGGGIAGASTAYHLARHGRSVTLLERGDIASEASGVNAGGIGALGWGHIPNLQSYLTMGSLQIFRSLQLELGYDIELRASGALQAIQTPKEYEFSRDAVLSLKSAGYTLELLSPEEARGMEPELNPGLQGAVHFPLRAQADPVKATQALAAAASQLGAQVKTGREVTELSPQANGEFRVSCAGEVHTARSLVLAAGAWCAPVGEMLGLRIGVVPVRGQMWATEPLPPRVFFSLSAAQSPLLWQLGPASDSTTPPELTHIGDRRITRHLYGRQTRDGEIIFGGDRQLAGYDKSVEADGIEVNFGHAREILPMLGQVSIARTWAGLMPFSLDGKPVIGKIPQFENLYIVSGLASSGFGRGPMAGKLIADYVHTGHRPPALAESDPARCVSTPGG
ncbi:MAG: FAD-dependent oxidoreductase [Chloroflexota bacterium]|nr:FAD-dependent oxidoreductase [Chloroflexota bacterium]